ncbi:MAG: Fe-S cluster assembly transcriptional regulator IscR [Acidobacteriota bacterium]
MRISARAAYASIAVLELAFLYQTGPVKTREIADRQGIPLKFLEQILHQLRSAGLVESIRGAGGGYVLARPPAEINLRQVVEAVEGELRILDLEIEEETVRRVWEEVQGSVQRLLEGITLKDLVERRLAHRGALNFEI